MIREHFDANTYLYVDKYEATYKALCQERLGLIEQYAEACAWEPITILDLGCGAGVFADMMLEKFPRAKVYCLDASFGMLRRNTPNCRKSMLLGDAKALPLRRRSFDLVNVDTLMHHLVDFGGYQKTLATIERFLFSLHGLLRPGGLVIVREIYHEFVLRDNLGARWIYELTTLRLPAPVARLLKRLGLKTANAGVCFLTRKQWREVLRNAGYRVASITDKPWLWSYLRIMGFRRSGDLYYVLSSDVDGGGPSREGSAVPGSLSGTK